MSDAPHHLAELQLTRLPRRVRRYPSSLLHRHDFFEIAFVTHGHCSWHLPENQRRLPMKAGSLLVLPPETLHCELYDRGVLPRIGWIGIGHRGVSLPPEALHRAIPVGTRAVEETERILGEAAREKAERARGWQQVVDLELRKLLTLIERWALTCQIQPIAPAHELPLLPARVRESLQKAADHLADHCAEPLRLTEVARQFHLSPPHFSSLFRRAMGLSPKKYILAARLARARFLIEQGEMTHAAIAQECGFYDEAHFSRTFKAAIGHAPGRDVPGE